MARDRLLQHARALLRMRPNRRLARRSAGRSAALGSSLLGSALGSGLGSGHVGGERQQVAPDLARRALNLAAGPSDDIRSSRDCTATETRLFCAWSSIARFSVRSRSRASTALISLRRRRFTTWRYMKKPQSTITMPKST